jgi:hypothetical protein
VSQDCSRKKLSEKEKDGKRTAKGRQKDGKSFMVESEVLLSSLHALGKFEQFQTQGENYILIAPQPRSIELIETEDKSQGRCPGENEEQRGIPPKPYICEA